MKQAIDLNTGRLVDADEASNWGRGTFKCPCCFDSVNLAWGAVVAPHFRHLHASYRTDCENYQVGDGGGGSGSGSGEGRWLALYAIPSIMPRNSSWRLELFVPDPGPSLQVAHYKDARGEQTIRNLKSSRGGGRIQVLPQDKVYRVVFGSKESGSDRLLDIPGLGRQFGNVFNYSDVAGRRLGDGEALVVGESYVVICHSTSRLLGWDQVRALQIGQNGEWFGTIVTLPPDCSQQLQSWCKRQFDREVIRPKARLTLLFPPSAAMLDDGTWTIPSALNEIYLACDGPVGAQTPAQVGWKYRYADHPRWFHLRGSLPAFFAETAQHKAWYEVLLRDSPRASLELLVGEQAPLTAPVGVQFVTRAEPKAPPRALPLLSPEAPSQLQAVREGKEELVSISLPAELPLKVTVRGLAERFWTTLSTVPEGVEDVASGTQLFDRLRSALAQSELSLRIDGGNFGFVELVGRTAHPAEERQVEIPDRLRDRFIWLLATASPCNEAAGMRTQPLGLPIVNDVVLSRVPQGDLSLIKKFVRVRGWPISLAAHARVAARELLELLRSGE